ncbi:MAG TPA: hypothetical protein VN372_00645 [Methanospirillum sp.]|nr:hypothetical protein [Methanospirillum sp.]
MRRRNRWWIHSIADVPDERKLTLKAQDGPVGTSWYSREFVRGIESVAEKKRLGRGLACARNKEACKLVIESGRIKIGISCSGYTIRDVDFMVSRFDQITWERLVATIAADAVLTGALVSGEFTEYFVQELRKTDINLLPTMSRDFHQFCNCGDQYDPCIHKIAAWYFVAEALDENPWILLTIRGKNRAEIIQAVKQVRPAPEKLGTPDIPVASSGFIPSVIRLPKTVSPIGFFRCEGEGPVVPLRADSARLVPVILLGKAPYYIGRKNLADLVIDLYPRICSYAESVCPD